jgi:hypothetical protein
MEYHTFDPETYELKFSSRGDATLCQRSGSAVPNVLVLPQFLLRKLSPANFSAACPLRKPRLMDIGSGR